jgi:deaminated glutathione amidase
MPSDPAKRLRVAVAQICSTSDVWLNLMMIDSFVKEAALGGASAVFFPENALYRGPTSGWVDAVLSPSFEGAATETLCEIASGWNIDVYLGSVLEARGDSERPYNTTLKLGNANSKFLYKKIHLFDFNGADRYCESDRVSAGDTVVCSELGPAVLGHSICYDLRFPELYRKMVLEKGANCLLIPAAFTLETGRFHWHPLLRARAIENLSFVLAPAQWGPHEDGAGGLRYCFGHSLILSPWGEVLAEAPEQGDDLLFANLDFSQLEDYRARLPSLSSTRLR